MPRSKDHERKRHQQRKARMLRIEIGLTRKKYLKDKSEEIGISQSQLVDYLVILDMAGASSQEFPLSKYLEVSNSRAWNYNLNTDRLLRDLGLEE